MPAPSLLRSAVLLALSLGAGPALAGPASVWVYAFDGATPIRDASATVDGKPIAAPGANGVIGARLAPGEHTLVIGRAGKELASIPLTVADDESVQVSISVFADRAPVYKVTSNLNGERTVNLAPATAPAATTAATAAGTASAVAADESGAGDADESTAGAGAGGSPASGEEVELSGITVTAGAMPTDDRAAFVDEVRASADVKEAISAEEIARSGDSDAAAALKRVTGLTLVEGKFVYVRGLGERYSSVLYNGAQLPSPDPTRRVVPLDLFPAELLEGVIVQKSYSPERPGEFGGGTVQLRTRNVPDDFYFKLSLGSGWLEDSSFEDGLRYEGGDRDWLGTDDGARELPDSIAAAIADGGVITEQGPFNPDGATPEQIQQYGRDLSDVWDLGLDDNGPPLTGTLGIGDSFAIGDDSRIGYIGGVRYAQEWDNTQEQRQVNSIGNEGLVTKEAYDRQKTEQSIDLSAFAGVGAELGANNRLRANWSLLRQTVDQAQIDTGYDDSPDEVSRFYELEWIENELQTWQLGGEHTIPQLHDLGISWIYSDSKATRDSPNTRRYRYDEVETPLGPEFRYSSRSNNNQVNFAELEDDVDELLAQFKLPFVIGDASYFDVYFGGDTLDRDRDSSIRRFQYLSRGTIGNDPAVVFNPSMEEVFSDPNIRPDGFVLREVTRPTDNYTASQALDAWYLNLDYSWNSKLRFTLGARREHNDQEVTTFQVGDPNQAPIVSRLDDTDVLPSFTTTWWIDDESQLRFAYSETLSRPDFRELSPAPFTDPVLDVESIGNPDLVQTGITNYDLRYEYYFSPSEVASVALFYKDFTRPIEKLQVPATGNVVSYFNADSGTDYGIELDYYRSLAFIGEWGEGEGGDAGGFPWDRFFFAFNYAWIESEVDVANLDEEIDLTNDSRPLQGQSPYVVNLQFGYQHPEGRREITLLYNRAGERIAQVGVQGLPDVYEQPFDQLDLTWLERFSPEWALKLRLRNLLNPEVDFTQGDTSVRSYEVGRAVLLTLEWTPQW